MPPDDYLPRIGKICRDNDILYISDEVVTGFGRLGHVFASQDVFGIDPDIITFAKGVTSGYFPLGGMIVSERLLAELRRSNHPDAMYAHGLTYTSHPVGCAVALKNLDLLEGGVLDHARSVAPYFQAQLKTLEELPLVGEVRGVGPDGLRRMRGRPREQESAGARHECRQAHRRALPRTRAAGAAADQHVRDVAAAHHHHASRSTTWSASCARAFRARWTICAAKACGTADRSASHPCGKKTPPRSLKTEGQGMLTSGARRWRQWGSGRRTRVRMLRMRTIPPAATCDVKQQCPILCSYAGSQRMLVAIRGKSGHVGVMTTSDMRNGAERPLKSWKEIALFFGRDERTVKRWEEKRGLPVHRLPGETRASVYAYKSELEEWLTGHRDAAVAADTRGAGRTAG